MKGNRKFICPFLTTTTQWDSLFLDYNTIPENVELTTFPRFSLLCSSNNKRPTRETNFLTSHSPIPWFQLLDSTPFLALSLVQSLPFSSSPPLNSICPLLSLWIRAELLCDTTSLCTSSHLRRNNNIPVSCNWGKSWPTWKLDRRQSPWKEEASFPISGHWCAAPQCQRWSSRAWCCLPIGVSLSVSCYQYTGEESLLFPQDMRLRVSHQYFYIAPGFVTTNESFLGVCWCRKFPFQWLTLSPLRRHFLVAPASARCGSTEVKWPGIQEGDWWRAAVEDSWSLRYRTLARNWVGRKSVFNANDDVESK